jgi:hypothetical protein
LNKVSCCHPGLTSCHDVPTNATHIAGIRGTSHHAQIICWDGVLPTFFLGWPQSMIHPIFTFCVEEIKLWVTMTGPMAYNNFWIRTKNMWFWIHLVKIMSLHLWDVGMSLGELSLYNSQIMLNHPHVCVDSKQDALWSRSS